MKELAPAPEWRVEQWLNTAAPMTLAAQRGRVVLGLAFQMLCPGCAVHALPQMLRVREAFPENELTLLGLHSVFEHHAAQGNAEALSAFLHEYRIGFPVGIDMQEADEPLPATMRAYAMQGTPTVPLIVYR
mgnify:CR=1 FL=1